MDLKRLFNIVLHSIRMYRMHRCRLNQNPKTKYINCFGVSTKCVNVYQSVYLNHLFTLSSKMKMMICYNNVQLLHYMNAKGKIQILHDDYDYLPDAF